MPSEALLHFKNKINLPMVLTVLTKDREAFEKGRFKLPGPYLDIAMDRVQADLKVSADFLRVNKMKLIKGKTEDTFTTYIFVYRI